MWNRAFERDLLPLCVEEGVAVIPCNPLAGGLLTGKHDDKAPPPEDSRFQPGTAGARCQERYWHGRQFETIEALRGVVAKAGISMTIVTLRWVLSNPAITAPVIGASTPDQLIDTLAAAQQGPLPTEFKARLDDVTVGWRAVDANR